MEEKRHTTNKKLVIEYQEDNGVVVEKRCVKCKEWRLFSDYPNLQGSFLNKNNHCAACEAKRAEDIRRSRGIEPKQPEVSVENGITSRKCSKCKAYKQLDEYDRNTSGFLGHDSECSECKRQRGETVRRTRGIQPARQVPILVDDNDKPTHRECSKCQKMLPLDNFHKHNGGTAFLNRHPYCKDCSAERHLITKYGITSADKIKMYQEQNSSCAICREFIALQYIHVDHCHASGKVRGLLCSGCNKALGLLKDDPERCIIMARYLNESIRST